jgi:hypothetical protein
VKLTTHFHLVPMIRISGAKPTYSHVPSWSAQEQVRLCEIWSCDSGDAEDSSLMGLEDLTLGEWFPMFRGTVVPLDPGSDSPRDFFLPFYCR